MAQKREDAERGKHKALLYIEKRGWTRSEAAIKLGVDEKYLNLVLDRWRKTSMRYAKLFHDVFGIPYKDLIDVQVRPDAKAFAKQNRERMKGK